MTITAKVVAHSRHPLFGASSTHVPDLITFELEYPRFIHAEVMTHRLFSRNASSSRAIPIRRVINDLLSSTAAPIHWGKHQAGMQADNENDAPVRVDFADFPGDRSHFKADVDGLTFDDPMQAWEHARNYAVMVALAFEKAQYHKQVVNRILEPYSHIRVIVTASTFDNFFWLRRHPDAQPEIRALADAMWEALQASTPRVLRPDEWHLPYIRDDERANHDTWLLLQMSTARCARVSYLTHNGEAPSIDADQRLYARLVGSVPLHASPAEHQARLDTPIWGSYGGIFWDEGHRKGNFDFGWVQHRQLLPNQHCDHYIPEAA